MRIFITTALILSAAPALAETAEQKQSRCETSSGIVADAVLMRSGGQAADEVEASLTTGDKAVEKRFVPAVAPLVDWVYTLDESLLDEKVSATFLQSCLDY